MGRFNHVLAQISVTNIVFKHQFHSIMSLFSTFKNWFRITQNWTNSAFAIHYLNCVSVFLCLPYTWNMFCVNYIIWYEWRRLTSSCVCVFWSEPLLYDINPIMACCDTESYTTAIFYFRIVVKWSAVQCYNLQLISNVLSNKESFEDILEPWQCNTSKRDFWPEEIPMAISMQLFSLRGEV